MKKIALIALILSTITACNTDGYKIKGKYPDAPDGTKVYIARIDENFTYTDSAMVKDGTFELSGCTDSTNVRMLLSSIAIDGGPIILEKGTIKVLFGKNFHRGGTPLNDNLEKFYAQRAKMHHKVKNIVDFLDELINISNEQRDSLQHAMSEAKSDFVSTLQEVMGGNMNNLLGAFLITQSEEYFTPEEFFSIMSQVPQHLRDKRFNAMYERVSDVMAVKERALATSIGKKYINFELPDNNGKQILFSDIVKTHKYTLLDFWASWCPPCRQEMPVINEIYKKYRNKGLAVVSLSLDSNNDEWQEGISTLDMQWTQLCEPKSGSAEVASAYGIEKIPTTLLIDSEGKIILRGVPAYRIAESLDKLLNP